MSAKASGGSRDLAPLPWVPMPMAHVPKTQLPLVRELHGIDALREWHRAGGDLMVLMGGQS